MLLFFCLAKGMRPITAPAPRSANARLVKRKPKDEAGRPVTAPVKELLLSNEGNSLSPDEILQRKKSAPIEIKEIRN